MNSFDPAYLASLALDPDFPSDRGAKVRIIVMDVDGVLTDGGLYYDSAGLSHKRFDVQDGLGIKMAQSVGLEFAVITGMQSESVLRRLEALGIDEVHSGVHNKLECLKKILDRRGLGWDAVAYVGDDWLDLPMFSRAGLPMSVRNAQPEVRAAALYVSPLSGGNGAMRQIIRQILAAQGKLEELVSYWLMKDE